MFNITIKYTQQISPDDFAVRHKTIELDIPELEQHYKESGSSYMTPHVVDVQQAVIPENKEDLQNNTQQLKAKISQLLNDIELDISCGNGINEKKVLRKLKKLSAI